MVVIEPVVNTEKAEALLREETESETLDFKEVLDLTTTRDVVELTKDVGAMGAFGGYILVGADSSGRLTARMTSELAAAFDEANVRQLLSKRLAAPVKVLTATLTVDDHTIVLIYVAPHPDGFAIFRADGQYDDQTKSGTKSKTVFRMGDVFVRHGTSSERWQQADITAVMQRREDRVREETRSELASVIAAVQQGQRGQQIARGPLQGFSWQLDQGSFDAAAAEVLRSGDRSPVRLFLIAAQGEASRLLESGDVDSLKTLLDRLVSLAGVAATLGLRDMIDATIKALLSIYRLGLNDAGQARNDMPLTSSTLWVELVGRVEALGGLAVRLEDWATVRKLTTQPPRTDDDYYPSWLRHAQVSGSRANEFVTSDGKKIIGQLVAVARGHVNRLPALRPDRGDDSSHDLDPESEPSSQDPLLDSICQFDALAGVAAMALSGQVRSGSFYTSFVGYYPRRTAPALVRLVTDQEMRQALIPGVTDETFRAAMEELHRMASVEGWNQRGQPWEVTDDRFEAFLRS